MKPRTLQRGFSLIEMLTVIAMLSVLTTISVSIFFKVTDGWTVARARGELGRVSQDALAQVAQDAGNVLSQRLTGVGLRGEPRSYQNDNPDSPFFRTVLEDDRLILPIQESDKEVTGPGALSVMYEVDRKVDPPALVRVLGPLGATPPAGARSHEWTGIRGFRVGYHDGTAWQPQWDGTTLPQAIRVSLSLADAVRAGEQLARSATYAIHVD